MSKKNLKTMVFLSTLLILLSATVLFISADEVVDVNVSQVLSDFRYELDYENFKSYLRETFPKFQKNINISSYKIADTNANRTAIRVMVWYDIPELFYVDEIIFKTSYGIIESFDVNYRCTKEEFTPNNNLMMWVVDSIVGDLRNNNAINDVYKALLIHDRLAERVSYDYKEDPSDINIYSTTMYGALVNNKARCTGYSKAYAYLLEQVGIESVFCTSSTLDHAWNIVTINGKKFHVDLTKNDPVDISGLIKHDYFMISSGKLKELYKAENIIVNDFDNTPNSTGFDDYFWRRSEAAFQYVDGGIYYIDNKSATINKIGGNNPLFKIKANWIKNANDSWTGNFSCLASDREALYYSDNDTLYWYDIKEKKSIELVNPYLDNKKYESVFGFAYIDNRFVIDVNNTPNEDYDTRYYWVFDLVKPTADIKVTNNNNAKQTVYIELNDNNGVAGYYWGNSSSYSANSYKKTSDTSLTFTITKAGTYYLTVKDVNDKLSVTYKLTFKKSGNTLKCDLSNSSKAVKYKLTTAPKLSITAKDLNRVKGSVGGLAYTVNPADSHIRWTSSDSAVATVDKSGKVTATGTGTAYITASMVYDGVIYKDSCRVVVTNSKVKTIEISAKPKTQYYMGDALDTTGLKIKVTYNNGNTAVIQKGFSVAGFTTSQAGKKTVAVNYAGLKTSYTVNIIKPTVTIPENTVTLFIGEKYTINAVKNPENAGLTWTFTDDGTISLNGRTVTANKKTNNAWVTIKIKYKNVDYGSVSCVVKVIDEPGITLDKDNVQLGKGGTATLTATAYPNSAKVRWESSNETIATVNNGVISGVKEGSCKITASITYNNKTYYRNCDVTVSTFSDVKEKHWFYNAVMYCNEKGFVAGTGNGKYSPSAQVTRAQMVQILFNMEGKNKADFEGPSGFEDVSTNAWYSPSIKWAKESGVTKGLTETTFAPNKKMTRQELAQFMKAFSEFKGIESEKTDNTLSAFADSKKVASWAKPAMQWAVAQGIITGAKSENSLYLNPTGIAKRNELAVIIMNYNNKLNKN